MAGFDPDAYLKQSAAPQGFDPDAYLGGRGTPPSEPKQRTWGQAAKEAVGAIPESAGKFVGGLAEIITSPIQTAKGLLDVAAGTARNLTPKAVRDFVDQFESNPQAAEQASSAAKAAGGYFAQRYGSAESIKNTLATDPVGLASDLSTIFSAGAGLAKALPAATKAGFAATKAIPAFQNMPQLTSIPQKIEAVAAPTAKVLETAAKYTNPLELLTPAAAVDFIKGPKQSEDVVNAIKQARDAGYAVPPSAVRPSVMVRMLEGLSGKPATGQVISLKNQQVTNRLAAQALGLSDDVKLTPDVLDTVRKEAGKAYQAISNLDDITVAGEKLPTSVPVKAGIDPYLNRISKVDPADLIKEWKQANSDAIGYYRAYSRDANPETLAKAKKARQSAEQIDDFLTNKLAESGQADLLNNLKDARVQIAKTYSVEKALNPVTGNVDARVLANDLKKGKVLTGELREAGEFASRFKNAAQTPEAVGSMAGVSPLDMSVAGITSLLMQDPRAFALIGTRPASRAALTSNLLQNRLVRKPSVITPEQVNYLNVLMQSQNQQGMQ